MRKPIVFLFLLVAAFVNCQNIEPSSTDPDVESTDLNDPVANTISNVMTYILNSETLQGKLTHIWNLIDLKYRFIRFIKSLLTYDNLILLRRLFDVTSTITSYLAKFLPDAPPSDNFLTNIFPVIELNSKENPVNLRNRINDDNEFLSTMFDLSTSSPSPSQQQPLAPEVKINPLVVETTNNDDDDTNDEGIRIDRSAKLTDDEEKEIQQHHTNILKLANLIYKTRQ